MTSPRSSAPIWPKPYLLQIYQQAIEHGFVWVGPLPADKATSLRASFNRLRRKGDADSALITPEMELVGMSAWQQHGDDPALGRLLVMYDRLPDGMLPLITPASQDEIMASKPIMPPVLEPLAATPEVNHSLDLLASSASLELDASDISSYVRRMADAAAEADDGDS